ncbi:hypothetical protein N9W31_00690 [Litoricolaceae bacterium]|nr:hypothetical protein [Litorivicinaceae bacterium]
MKLPKTIVVGVGNGFAFRFFISSGLVERLQRQGYVIYLIGDPVFSNSSSVSFLKGNSQIIEALDNRSYLKRFFEYLRANCLPRDIECLTIKQFRHQELSKMSWLKRLIFVFLWFVFAYSNRARRLFLLTEKCLTDTRVLEEQLRSVKADFVIVGGLSGFQFDEIVGEGSLRCGVPVISAILSWDNLSGLGYRFFDPSLVLVWSEIMKGDAVKIHRCNPDNVKIVGAIPFYKHFELITSNKASAGFVAVANCYRTICFLTKSPKRFAFNLALFRKIRNEVINQGVKVNWIIRIHPLTLRTNSSGEFIFKDEIEGFKELALEYHDIELSLPDARGTRVVFENPDSDLAAYLAILQKSDLVVSMFSTAMLECALLDIPTANICVDNSIFDPFEATGSVVTSTRQELSSDFKQDHIRSILDLGEIETYHSVAHLAERVKLIVLSENPSPCYQKTKGTGGLLFSMPVDNAIKEITNFAEVG